MKYIRDDLRTFITTIGYDPVLSERGDVFYNPILSAQDSCLAEVKNCQMLLLIIGGRSGSFYKDTSKSITNAEYNEAAKNKIPIFALVEHEVLADYDFYVHNREHNKDVGTEKIKYRVVDSLRVFDFIEEVQKNAVNNALVPFSSPTEMKAYLKEQWAAMMYNFLSGQAENKRVATVLDSITVINERIEFLATQILQNVGTNTDKAMIEFNKKMERNAAFQFLRRTLKLPIDIKLLDIINNADLTAFLSSIGYPTKEEKADDKMVYSFIWKKNPETKFFIDSQYYFNLQLEYDALRKEALVLLKKYHIT